MSSALFTNAKLWQPEGGFDESFAIEAGHVSFTGSNKQADALKSSYKQIIDLKGRLVLPGLIDGHLHLVKGSLMRKRLDCSVVTDIDSLSAVIERYEKNNPQAEWIIGSNLYAGEIIKNADLSTGNFVDKIYGKKPLFITNYDYHSAICNSKSIELSGIASALNSLSSEEVVRNSEGRANGLIKEKAMGYLYSALPAPSLDDKVKAVEEFISVLHSYGITTVTDITLTEDLEVYKKLYELDKLKIRINSYIPFDEFINLAKYQEYTKEINPDFFTILGFKSYWDGALGSETALFSQNYLNRQHNGYKTEIVESGRIFKLAKDITGANMQMIIHAIGDKAVTEAVNLYESLYDSSRNTRHRIEHAQHIQDSDFERFKTLNVMASAQPLHLKYDIKAVKEKLPPSLVNKTHNYKKLIDIGAVVNFGTDFPIVEVNPFENIRLALTRKGKDGVFTPEFAIGMHDCIKCYTFNNAYTNFNENAIGSIAKGKAADFVIMEDDLFEIEGDNITNARVYKTYLNGGEVYSADNP